MTRRISPLSAAVALMLGAAATAPVPSVIAQNQPVPPPAAAAPAAPAPPAAAAPVPAAPPVIRGVPGPMQPPRPPMMMPPPPPQKPAKPLIGPPGVAATVNGQTITTTEVKEEAYRSLGPRVVDSLITNLVIDQEARRLHLAATPADIDAKVAEMRKQIAGQFPGQSLETLVTNSGHTMDELRTNMKTRVELEKLIGHSIAPAKATHVRHILIRTQNVGPSDPNTKIHSEAEAKEIIAKIQADLRAGKSFVAEANQYTEDPSGKNNGGDLPVVTANSPMDQSFLAAAMKLKKGDVTPEPVTSMYGLHLIECDSTSDDPTPADKPLFAQAEESYKQQQVQMQAQSFIQTLRNKAKIVNYLANGVPAPTAPAKSAAPAAPKKTAAIAATAKKAAAK